jgi:peroxiredoxin
MTQRQRSEWFKQWYQTPEARTFYDAIWHDLNRRHYTFRINEDGSFRIEDVTPGKYQMTVYLEERLGGDGRPEEIGGYTGTIEVPPMTQAYTEEPLDIGELTPAMRRPLHVGDVAPAFGARTLDGRDIHLADYKGKFVLLNFWQPEYHPELDRLKELYKTYGSTGKLQIIGLGGDDTLEEVKKYVAEHGVEWPEIYFGEKWGEGVAGQYGLSGLPYILLVNPEGKIVTTWLRGERLTSAISDAMKNADGSASGKSSAGGAGLAWQRTNRYVPPDPNSFFPDDPEAGKRLDTLFNAGDRDGRSDEEILSTVRQGFRRMTQSRNSVLQWVGNRFIWGKQPQNPEAIELMYHAVSLERYYAVYFGLSVVKNKSPNLLRTLADLCMQGEQVGRITWGLGPQREEMLAYITPYLQDADPKKREIAEALVRHFKGELDFEKWQQEKHTEQVKAEFTGQLPQLRQALLTGDSQARRDVFQTITRKDLSAILDDSFLPALRAAATDSDSSVRAQVAQLVGGLWVWGAKDQDPNAIEFLLKLSTDSARDVRYTAVYYGLSNVRNASEPVVRRLIEMALADHENDLHGRIVWGLKGPVRATPELVTKTLAEYLDRAKSDLRHAACVYALYRDILEKEPPSEWNLARIRERYPEDLFGVPFSAKGSFQPQDADALWAEFAKSLPQGITAECLVFPKERRREILCVAKVRGKEQVEVVKSFIENHPRLSLKETVPLSLSFQLYFEELSALERPRSETTP